MGLVEMSRKRVRQDLRALLTQSCPTCRGGGVVKSNETLATEIYRAIQAKAAAEAPLPRDARSWCARIPTWPATSKPTADPTSSASRPASR